jgi:hypothetical protein
MAKHIGELVTIIFHRTAKTSAASNSTAHVKTATPTQCSAILISINKGFDRLFHFMAGLVIFYA